MQLNDLIDSNYYYVLLYNQECGRLPWASGREIKSGYKNKYLRRLDSVDERLPEPYYPLEAASVILGVRPFDQRELATWADKFERPRWCTAAVRTVEEPKEFVYIPKPGTAPKKSRGAREATPAPVIERIHDDLSLMECLIAASVVFKKMICEPTPDTGVVSQVG